MPLLRSWVDSANSATCAFPLNNLPCGVFSTDTNLAHCGVAIGDKVLDVTTLEEAGLLKLGKPAFEKPSFNALMALGPDSWRNFRQLLVELLLDGSRWQAAVAPHLHDLKDAKLHLPFEVTEYTDFYAGRNHAFNVGTMFRGPETRFRRTGFTSPLAIMGGPPRSWYRAQRFVAHGGKSRVLMISSRGSLRRADLISSLNLERSSEHLQPTTSPFPSSRPTR